MKTIVLIVAVLFLMSGARIAESPAADASGADVFKKKSLADCVIELDAKAKGTAAKVRCPFCEGHILESEASYKELKAWARKNRFQWNDAMGSTVISVNHLVVGDRMYMFSAVCPQCGRIADIDIRRYGRLTSLLDEACYFEIL